MAMIIAMAERRRSGVAAGVTRKGRIPSASPFCRASRHPSATLSPAFPSGAGFPDDVASLEEAVDHGDELASDSSGPFRFSCGGRGRGATVQNDIKRTTSRREHVFGMPGNAAGPRVPGESKMDPQRLYL